LPIEVKPQLKGMKVMFTQNNQWVGISNNGSRIIFRNDDKLGLIIEKEGE